MDRYHRVEKPKMETSIGENEIRITSQGRIRSYITYAMSLLQEKESDEIVFKAMGRAINKTVTIVELIKRRIVGLHQITSIQSTDITDTWEPLEEGLQTLETTRKVSMITITLAKTDLDKTNAGYQPPIPADQVKVSTELDYDGEGSPPARGRGRFGRGRGRPRGRSGNDFVTSEYDDGGHDQNHGYARGNWRGRGRVRNFRSRGRGGYNDSQVVNQYDAGGYNQGNDFASSGYDDGGYDQNHGYARGNWRGRGRVRNFRSHGRGGYNGSQVDNQYDAGAYNQGNDFATSEYDDGGDDGSRGRVRNFRGRGRGGYNGSQVDNQYDAGGYNQEVPRGRGRGRGPHGRGRGFRPNGPFHTSGTAAAVGA